jgi:hypothetical protein
LFLDSLPRVSVTARHVKRVWLREKKYEGLQPKYLIR